MSILVVGGAGYIGSQMCKMLFQEGYSVVVLDNLSTGHRESVKYGEFIEGAMQDRALLRKIFNEKKIEAVMHFAASSQVGESIQNPLKYYTNNVANTLILLEEMINADIKKFIFSSTAAVFGNPDYTPIDEDHLKKPINPYGLSKLIVENILADLDKSHDFKSIILRYFNAAGADKDGELGERHDPETHLIPLVLQAASGRRENIQIYGQDYNTPDGTCIRDYIHVEDLCHAHLLALKYLFSFNKSNQFNLGNGTGFSVKQVISTADQVVEGIIPVVYAERRTGDPEILVADSTKITKTLQWHPRHIALADIIKGAWEWEKKMSKMN